MKLESYDDLMLWIKTNNKESYYFRGYKEDFQLISTLGRKKENKESKVRFEFLLFQAFALELVEKLGELRFTELVEIAQHFGLPTRYIDFTIDPLIAVFFGLGEEDSDCKFRLCYVTEDNPLLQRALTPLDRTWEELFNNNKSWEDVHETYQSWQSVKCLESNTPLKKNHLIQPAFENEYKNFFSRQEDFTLVLFSGEKTNTRKMAQKGIFIAMKNPEEKIKKELYEEIEVELSNADKLRLRKLLEKENYTYSNLFPRKIQDIDIVDIAKKIKN